MNPLAAIERAIADHNRDLTTQAITAVAMGLLTSLAIYAFIVMAFFILWFGRGRWFLYATGVFLLFFIVGLWSSRRGVDPLEDVDPFNEDDFGAVKATYALTGLIASPRHTVAGAAGLVLHGPQSLLQAVSLWRDRIPSDPTTSAAAASLLGSLIKEGGVTASAIDSKAAASLLLRLSLAKLDRTPGTAPALRATAKGIAAHAGTPVARAGR